MLKPKICKLSAKNKHFLRNDHEVEFHEIKIELFQEIEFSIMRSKFNLFMRSNLFINIWQFWSGGWHFDHEIKIQKSIIRNFDLMINLLVKSTIMRSKFKKKYFNLVSYTCGKFLALITSHLCIKAFDLMIALAANKSIMRSKFPNNAFFEFWSHDWFVSRKNDHEIKTVKSIIREFWSHEISCDQEIK